MMTQFAPKMTAVLLMLGGLSACQMMSARPYDGVLGYTVQQQNGQKIDFRYVDEDRHDWPSMIKRSEKLCAKLQNRPPQSVQLEGVQQQTVEKNIAISTHIPQFAGLTSKNDSNSASSNPTPPPLQPHHLTVQDQAQRKFKQLDATCTLR